MGEEEKKPVDEKTKAAEAEKKKEEAPKAAEDGKKEEKAKAERKEIVLKLFMHCEGCAKKVRRCLKGFEGVENVVTDCKTSKVVVKGEKADPMKVLERVQRKSHRKVELISPIPKPPPPPPPKELPKPPEKEVVQVEEKKEEPCPCVITVVLGVYMHCDACAQEIRKRILRMKGIESAETDFKDSQVSVKGVVEPKALVDYVYKKTGKHAAVVKVEPEKTEEEDSKPKEEKQPADDQKPEAKKVEEETKESKDSSGGEAAEVVVVEEGDLKMELRKNEIYYNYPPQNYYPFYPQQLYVQEMNFPAQMFSDENPNACVVM